MFIRQILKIISAINLWAGIILRRKKIINPLQIKKILVNRADRLGDAAVSLPLLMQLGKKFDITVLTSAANDLLLRGFFKTQIITDRPLSIYDSFLFAKQQTLKFSEGLHKAKAAEYDVYLDLTGIAGLNILKKLKSKNICRYYIGFNLGVWNCYLDYSAYGNPVLFSKKHILDNYNGLITKGLGVKSDIPDYIDLTSKMQKPQGVSVDSPYILVNISGFSKFRGPTPGIFAKILDRLDFKGKIIVMDELGRSNIEEFKKSITRGGITYLENDFSQEELLCLSAQSMLYIGSDSGITQLLTMPANCVIFFGTGSPGVWKPYSKNPYCVKNQAR